MSQSRRVVVLPGRNMGPYIPQLLFPTFAAIRRGAMPEPVEWNDVETVDGLDPSQIEAWVTGQVEPALDRLVDCSTIVIGKSLGTYAATVTSRLALPAIWVTPPLTNPFVLDALSCSRVPFLLVGGTDDPVWDSVAARELTPHVLELSGADHGLFVPGPLELSAQNIAALATATETFLDDVVWPAVDASTVDSDH